MTDWTRAEVEATVADYFAMFEAELRGEAYSKAEHRRRLSTLLDQRRDGAIERKHQNISAVLIELGLPYIDGYKPLSNYQRLLAEVVKDSVTRSSSLLHTVVADIARPSQLPEVDDILKALVEAPKSLSGSKRPYPREVRERPQLRLGVNYLALEAANHALGASGEEFVVRFEQARLVAAKEEHLASRVKRVSVTEGDGAGFDILSFERGGRERLIEVKTTGYGPYVPFYVSRNELRTSRAESGRYHLYRVFAFRKRPQLFTKCGALEHSFDLDPVQFEARIA